MAPHSPTSPFPTRLKQARIMRRWSLRDLSENLDGAVSHAALAKYENGVMQPSSDILSQLSSSLKLPPDFFFRPLRVSVEKVSFRKRKAFGEKDTAAILENIRSRLEDYLETEEFVSDVAKLQRDFSLPKENSPEEIRKFAGEVRRKWGLSDEPIPALVQLLENRGIRVIAVDEPSSKFDGCQIDGLDAIAIGLRSDLPAARKRFTIAHELAHVLLNDWLKEFKLTEKDSDRVMDKFAAEFLLPESALRRYFGNIRTTVSEDELVNVKLRYGISIASIVYSFKAFGIIGENAYKRFQIKVGSKWRSMGFEPGDDKLKDKEHPERFRRLVLHGVSEGNISLSRAAGLLGISLTEMRKEAVPIVE